MVTNPNPNPNPNPNLQGSGSEFFDLPTSKKGIPTDFWEFYYENREF